MSMFCAVATAVRSFDKSYIYTGNFDHQLIGGNPFMRVVHIISEIQSIGYEIFEIFEALFGDR